MKIKQGVFHKNVYANNLQSVETEAELITKLNLSSNIIFYFEHGLVA
tara:strand:- start:26400 stop:26540 length:141 start_codon:yes stop_codon:yes gene_type:complete